MFHTIAHAVAEYPYQVRLTYKTGETIIVDFTPYIERGGIFAPLKDPSFFAQVSVGENGRYLAWPGEIEFCADALWLKQEVSETPGVELVGEVA